MRSAPSLPSFSFHSSSFPAVLFELYHNRHSASEKTHFSSEDEDDEFDLEEDDLPPGKSSFFSRFIPQPSFAQITLTPPAVPPCTISA